MFVLNCTQSCANLITTGIESAPEIGIDDNSHKTMQWVLYAFQAKRKNFVIIMHAISRYSILLVNVKKQSSTDFFKTFLERLANEMAMLCKLNDEQFQLMLNKLTQAHPKFVFCQRSDRSVQKHVNDIVWHFRYALDNTGHLPTSIDDAYCFGSYVNEILRRSKRDKDYFMPHERMRDFWLQSFVEKITPNVEQITPKNVVRLADYKRGK